MTFVVLAIWLVGTWVTKFSLEEMALYTPIAVLALGALAATRRAVGEDHLGVAQAPPRAGDRNRAPSDGVRTVGRPCSTAPGRSILVPTLRCRRSSTSSASQPRPRRCSSAEATTTRSPPAPFSTARCPGHDPFPLGDMAAAVARIDAAVAAGARVCVHGDYDVDGICATALAVLALRELGAEVMAPAEPVRGGLRRLAHQTIARLADDGVDSCSRSTAASPRSRRSPRRTGSGSTSSSPTTTVPATTSPRARRRDASVGVPVSRALRHRRRPEARPGAGSASTIRL